VRKNQQVRRWRKKKKKEVGGAMERSRPGENRFLSGDEERLFRKKKEKSPVEG